MAKIFRSAAFFLALSLALSTCGGGGGDGEPTTGTADPTEYVGTYHGTWHNSLYNQDGTLEVVITSYSGSTLVGYVNDHEGEGNVPFASGYITGSTFSATVNYVSGQTLVMNGTFSASGATTLTGTYQSSPSEYGYGTYTVTKAGTPTPSVTTLSATSVSATGATLNGTVTPNGVATTACFEWGTDPALSTYSSTSTQSAGSGTTSQSINAALTGLLAGTTYYCRVVASNASGTSQEAITSFTTSAPGSAPAVTTLPATSVSATGATLNGNVTPNGMATTYWIEYGTSTSLATYSSTTAKSAGSGTDSQSFGESVTGLQTATIYYFRAAATNSGGTSRGSIGSLLTTTGAPITWSGIYTNGARANDIRQTSDGGYIVAGFDETYTPYRSQHSYLLRTDANGNTSWETNGCGVSANAVRQTSDGGYVVAGRTYHAGEDVCLSKKDANGNTHWEKTYAGSAGNDVQQTSDGGYIVAGVYHVSEPYANYAYLIKTDANGNVQ